jgi:hypothetical protein
MRAVRTRDVVSVEKEQFTCLNPNYGHSIVRDAPPEMCQDLRAVEDDDADGDRPAEGGDFLWSVSLPTVRAPVLPRI